MERKTKSGTPKTRLSSVANALRLLKEFSGEEYEIGISSLGKRLVLPKSSVHRLATTLVEAGMLEQNAETGKYRLGLLVFELGSLVRRRLDFSTEAKPHLMMLREKTGESVHLAILDHATIIYINYFESRQAIRMSTDVGLRRPAHCTAEGKILLAHQPQEVIEDIIAAGLRQFTPNTITDPAAFRKELTAVRARGYAIDDEECDPGMRCIAAPVRNHNGEVIAAASVAGPAQRLTKKALLSLVEDVTTVADTISRRLGNYPLHGARFQWGA
jgi:IclR family KDG regulon transcriptional repressor